VGGGKEAAEAEAAEGRAQKVLSLLCVKAVEVGTEGRL
jgi:hypothetical protein